MLNSQAHQQFIEADGRESVVLSNLGDSDGLRAAQNVSGIVCERLLLRADFFEQGVTALQQAVLLLQFVSAVPADSRKDFAGDPTLESTCRFEFRRKDERVESAFVDDGTSPTR